MCVPAPLLQRSSAASLTGTWGLDPGDNRCTLHYAVHDHGDAARRMLRITISDADEVRGPQR